jgi:hypothetical protein
VPAHEREEALAGAASGFEGGDDGAIGLWVAAAGGVDEDFETLGQLLEFGDFFVELEKFAFGEIAGGLAGGFARIEGVGQYGSFGESEAETLTLFEKANALDVGGGVLAEAGLGFARLRENAFAFIEADGFYAYLGLPGNLGDRHSLIVIGYLPELQQVQEQLESPQGQVPQQEQDLFVIPRA